VSDAAVTRAVTRVELDAGAVLRQAWALYRRLFVRSMLMGGVVFGSVRLLEALAGRSGAVRLTGLLALVLAVFGTALVQGGLVEIVRGLHHDGDDDASVVDVLGRAGGRTPTLVGVSLLMGLGIGVGLVLLVVPGLVLATRWAIAVPVAMLEQTTARGALRRSREIVRGNGWNVFKVLFAVGVLTALAAVPLDLASVDAGPLGWWVATTIASMLTAPYAAHALTVVYYALREPDRPVVLERGRRWQSVWDEQDAANGLRDDDEPRRDPPGS
jgi:hypothetical protein